MSQAQARPPGESSPAGESISIEAQGSEANIPVESSGVPAAKIEHARSRRHRFAATVTMVLFAVAAFATGLWLFDSLLMPRLIHSASEVHVPDLANLSVEQAEKALRPLGLELSRSGERFDASTPAGFVVSQEPAPDTPVRGKRRVMVVVSLGEEFSTVPALFGESLRGARLLIERAGLTVGGLTRAPSEDVGEALVVSSDPSAESVLPRDTPVALLTSTGAGEEIDVMPDLLGREIGGVRRQLEAMGYKVFTPPAAPSLGAIVSQTPAAGSRITPGSTIVLQAMGRIIR